MWENQYLLPQLMTNVPENEEGPSTLTDFIGCVCITQNKLKCTSIGLLINSLINEQIDFC